MKIKFLGTSAGWPLPRLGHKCELCNSKDPKDKRLRSSVLVNEYILVDAGPDTYQKLLKIDSSKIKYVILTHWHPDHTLGVWDLTHIYLGLEKKRDKPIIFASLPTLKFVNSFINRLQDLETVEISFNQKIDLDGIEFSNFEVVHTEGTIAVKLTEGKKTFIYIPDFKKIPAINFKHTKGADLLVMDGSSLTHIGETPGHQTIEQGIKLAQKLKVKQASFTHFGHDTDKHVNIEKFVKRNGGKNFFIPYDGLEIKL